MSTDNHFDILSSSDVNQEYVINVTKENIDSADQKTKEKSKILKFSSKWSFEDVVVKIPTLDVESYPKLFIFVADIKANDFCGSLKFLESSLVNFSKSRSIILQLTSSKQKSTKIYYKDGDCKVFIEIKGEPASVTDFPTFLWFYLSGKIDKFEDVMLDKLPKIKNSQLILKFLRTLKLSEEFFDKLVLKCSAYGSESDLLAAIDGFYDSTGTINGTEVELFLSCEFCSTSDLHTAVQNPNQVIISFLIKKYCNWIQQLSFDHQIEISTAAFTSGQLDVLSSLLKFCDFPFPKDFKPESITHERLKRIVDDRTKFHEDVLAENRQEIRSFIDKYSKLKFAFNLENKSAIGLALESKKFESFTFLKANRFRDNEIEDISIQNLTEEDQKSAKKYALVQTRKNVNISYFDKDISILQLAMRSLIYNRDGINSLEKKQREKIKKWYSEIYKTKYGSKLMDAAAQCKDLKIIFDFECESTENVDVSSTSGSLGVTFPISKWIFIGAKLTDDERREQKIKGVIAHEICHYVMRLVYQNSENPYYGYDGVNRDKFEGIVNEIDLMLFPKKTQKEEQKSNEEDQAIEIDENDSKNKESPNSVDDQCDGTISTVYTLYPKKDWHPELIVRPAQMQAEFDDDEAKISELEQMYKNLFEFFEQFVLPEIKKFCLQKRADIQIFNGFIGIISELQNSPIKLQTKRDFNELLNNNSATINSNIPKLLMLDIYNHVAEKYQGLLDVKNIFVTPENLKINAIRFDAILKENSNLNIFVDCTKECKIQINQRENLQLFFITSKDIQTQKTVSTSPPKMTINYNWIDLTAESQKLLLQTKINFQSKSTFLLSELILNETYLKQPESILNEDLTDIIDDQLLNLLVEKEEIKINQQTLENIEDKQFRILFQTRSLIKNSKSIKKLSEVKDNINEKVHKRLSDGKNMQGTKKNKNLKLSPDTVQKIMNHFKFDKTEKISQEQMLEDVKNKKFVLISDKAGSGKSWIIKNFTNRLQNMVPNKWTTYVDLKQFIKEFKEQNTELEFAAFMTEKILKPKSKYEAEIFKKLYKNGKIYILFDGFDEIAPDCAELVTKLFQSFQKNDGNQLWIATRDYFEVDLKEKLELDDVYKMDDFSEEHGVELIASSWMLNETIPISKTLTESDVKKRLTIMAESDILNHIKTSQNMQKYKEIAENLIKKIPKTQNNSIGLPQFYKMIADITQESKNDAIDFTTFKIFEECVKIQCERWSIEKGELRTNECIRIQYNNSELNYQKLHQLVAMKSLFPDETQFCDLNIKALEYWNGSSIIGCGILTEKDGIFLFSHETFREYFVAKFILRILMKTGTRDDDQVCGYLIQILTVRKYGIIRMFLNEAFAEKSTLMEIERKIPKINENFCKNIEKSNLDQIEKKIKSICDYFYKNIEKLENLDIIFRENLENVADLLLKVFEIGSCDKVRDVILRNQKILEASTGNNKLFAKVQAIVLKYLKGNDFENFIKNNRGIFAMVDSSLDAGTIIEFLNATMKKIDLKFVIELLRMRRENEENVFFYLVRSKNFSSKSIQKVIQILKEYLKIDEIIELIKKCNYDEWNILHVCIKDKNAKKLDELWNSLKLVFELEDFKNLVCQKTVKSKNILHCATSCEKIEFHETLLRLLLNTLESRQELLPLIMQRDKDGDNLIHRLLISNKADVIEFYFKKLREVFNDDQYKEILNSKGYANRSLLQSAADYNRSFTAHQVLWKIYREYFDNSEMLAIMKHTDDFGDVLIIDALEYNTKEVVMFIWNEILEILIITDQTLKDHLSECGDYLMICLKNRSSDEKMETMKLKWNKIIQILEHLESQQIINKELAIKDIKSLHNLALCDKLENHKAFWQILLNTIKNKDDLKDLMLLIDFTGNNFLHFLVSRDNPDIIEFTLDILKNNFSEEQFNEILLSRGQLERNLIQNAVKTAKNIKTHQILWKILQDSCKSEHEFLEFVKQVDRNGSNVLHLAASASTTKIFGFIIKTLEKITSKDEIKNLLSTFGDCDENIIHAATASNNSLELHQKLWKIIVKYFSRPEILKMIKYFDDSKDNILHDAVYWNTKEIVEFTWNQIKNCIETKENQAEYLKIKGHDSHNLLELASENILKDTEVHAWVKNLMNDYRVNNEKLLLNQLNLNFFDSLN